MPYTIGLQSAANAFVSAGFATQFTVAVITFLSIVTITSAFQKDAPDAPASLPGLSLRHVIPFYRRRFDFLNWAIHATGQTVFQFKLLRNTVVVVSGESGRQAFFSAKGLDLTEGFKILSGAIPNVSGVTTDLQNRRIAAIHKRVAAAQREGHIRTLLPHLLEDSRRVMERWGTSGKFDPFENVYELTFQTTMRALSCAEIADDHALVSRIKKLYDQLDEGTTPATILMPWLPSWTMLTKLWSTKEIYNILSEAVKQRQELLLRLGEASKPQDTMQLLFDAGDDKLAIVGFIMGLLIAGARATGTSASWLVTFLASHPEWARKARAEVEDLLATHIDVRFNSRSIPTSPWLHSGAIPALSPVSPNTGSYSVHDLASKSPRGSQKTSRRPTWPPLRPLLPTATTTPRFSALPQICPSTTSRTTSLPDIVTSATCAQSSPQSTLIPAIDGEEERRIFSGPLSLLGDPLKRRQRRDSIHISPPSSKLATTASPIFPSPTTHTSVPVSYSPPPSPQQNISISESLNRIPLETWESSTPILDALIKETLRVAQPHAAMRRNMGPEFYIDGKLVESGAYVVYPFSDVHLDESIYEKAGTWMPGRWLSGDEEKGEFGGTDPTKGVPFGYVGWGGGKSMCLGTRLAKIELKLIISMFVLGYDLGVVDEKGKPKPIEEMPSPNWNDILLCRPEKKGEFYVGFERRRGVDL